jgi:spermidine synthase
MKPRRLIDAAMTPAGEPIELLFEAGHYVVRMNGAVLMSSAAYGSEQAMASVAAKRLVNAGGRVLIGGLGLGFTLRAALDVFAASAEITIGELMPAIVGFNRGELGELTGRPLDDPRVRLVVGDVSQLLTASTWDAVLLDVDNGPEAFSVPGNAALYGRSGTKQLVESLTPGGVAVVWSAFVSRDYEQLVTSLGFVLETVRVPARSSGKGARHALYVITR